MKEVVDLLLFAIALVFLVFASICDIKKKEVPNWISFSLLFIALAVRGIGSLVFQDFSYFYWALIAVAIFLAISELFYRGMVFGGGDQKILIALAAVFATRPFFATNTLMNEPFLLTFFINSFFLGSIWGIFVSIHFFINFKDKPKFIKNFKEIIKKRSTKLLIIFFTLCACALLVFSLLMEPYFIFVSVILLIFPYLFAFIKVIEKNYGVKLVSPEKLTEGDYLFKNVRVGQKTLKRTADGLSKEDILLLKKAKKKVLIIEGLIFVPILLIGLIISLFYGNILSSIIYGIIG